MKLNSDFKQLWLSALRSGEIAQAQGQLCVPEKRAMCCLGVAATCANPFQWELDGDRDPAVGGYSCFWWEERLGLDMDDALLLTNMNDSGTTFTDIADYIESEL